MRVGIENMAENFQGVGLENMDGLKVKKAFFLYFAEKVCNQMLYPNCERITPVRQGFFL